MKTTKRAKNRMNQKQQQRLDNLYDKGYRVKSFTNRYVLAEGATTLLLYSLVECNMINNKDTIYGKGGNVRVIIFHKDSPNTVVAEGLAKCSLQDNFNKKLGFQIAFGRAYKKLTNRLVKA